LDLVFGSAVQEVLLHDVSLKMKLTHSFEMLETYNQQHSFPFQKILNSQSHTLRCHNSHMFVQYKSFNRVVY